VIIRAWNRSRLAEVASWQAVKAGCLPCLRAAALFSGKKRFQPGVHGDIDESEARMSKDFANGSATVAARRAEATRSKTHIQGMTEQREKKHETNLGGLAHFLPDHLPLVVLVVFDGLHQRSALFQQSAISFFLHSRVCEADEAANLVFREFGVMHVLFGGKPNRVSISLCQGLVSSMREKERGHNLFRRCPRLQTSQEVGTHFVPMFLYTTLGAQREGLCDFTPAAASIAQRF